MQALMQAAVIKLIDLIERYLNARQPGDRRRANVRVS
jgi:hypothetical protein